MPRKLLTDLVIRNAKPTAEQYDIWDKKVRGLTLRISPGGAKSFNFIFKHRGHGGRITLGRTDAISLVDARRKAQKALTDLANGIDPRHRQTPENAISFADLVTEYLDHPTVRAYKSWKEKKRILQSEFVPRWNLQCANAIGRSAISSALREIQINSGESSAIHAFAVVKRVFNWSVEQGLLDSSPCTTMKPPAKAQRRQRVLSDHEIRTVWSATEQIGYPYGPFIQLLFLTGQRRSEVAALRWSDLNLSEALWFQSNNKSERPHIIPLSPLAVSIIRSLPRLHSEMLFPARGRDIPLSGFSKWKKQLDHFAGVNGWTVHDIRRTAATGMAKLHHPHGIVERILNHSPKEVSGIGGVYDLYDYLSERRIALEDWSRHVQEVTFADATQIDDDQQLAFSFEVDDHPNQHPY